MIMKESDETLPECSVNLLFTAIGRSVARTSTLTANAEASVMEMRCQYAKTEDW